METMRVKLKVGEHEFEAEGPLEAVQSQLATWKDLITEATTHIPKQCAQPTTQSPTNGTQSRNGLTLDAIMKLDGRVVSLTARGQSSDDEIMLVLLGQKMLRSNDAVTGAEITSGLRQTGGLDGRIDYRLNKMIDAGEVVAIGERRGRRYRLTNTGLNKAQEISRNVIATVA